MHSLNDEQRRIAEAIQAAAFVNPFSDERREAESRIIDVAGSVVGGNSRDFRMVVAAWIDSLPPNMHTLQRYAARDRELMRSAFLFDVYHRHIEAFDKVIETEQAKPGAPARVPFVANALQRLEQHGFTREEGLRVFGLFYQLRRAHFFIVRGLQGKAACMKEFRRRLWTNVFTENVHRYEELLWNRMEDFSTLLLGETGAGKGAAAAAIGRSGYIPFDVTTGAFAESFTINFVAANLAQYPETLLEAELFGYRKGAFTGANEPYEGLFGRCSPHGAVFLDEIGEINCAIQVKLLNVLQDRQFSPVGSRERKRFHGRLIAATNRTVEELGNQKLFRQDFFYRISSDVIHVPSLRERLQQDKAELPLLIEAIVRRTLGQPAPDVNAVVEDSLKKTLPPDYAWPGNVRELEQAIRRILLTGAYRPAPVAPNAVDPIADALDSVGLTADQLLSYYVQRALETYGTRAEVARRLDMDPRTVERYLKLAMR